MPPVHITGPARPPQRDEKDAEQRQQPPPPASMRNAASSNNRASDATLNHVGYERAELYSATAEHFCFQLLAFTLPPRAHPVPRTSRRSGRNAPTWGRSTRERRCSSSHCLYSCIDVLALRSLHCHPRCRHRLHGPRSPRTLDIAYNTLGYLNAQFKFMLKPTGDYTVHFADRKYWWFRMHTFLVPAERTEN
jgi:hypothetical protein